MTKVLLDELFWDGVHWYGAQAVCLIPSQYAVVGNILYFQKGRYPWKVLEIITDPNAGTCDISGMGPIVKCE